MTRAQLKTLQARLKEELAARDKIGGYGQDADAIRLLFAVCANLVEHLLKPVKKA